MIEDIQDVAPPFIDLSSPLFWASVTLAIIGVLLISKKSLVPILVGCVFLLGATGGFFVAVGNNDKGALGKVALVVIFICAILMVATRGWVSTLVGLFVAVVIYFEFEKITPPDTLLGQLFALIRTGAVTLWETLTRLAS